MVIFHSYVSLPEGTNYFGVHQGIKQIGPPEFPQLAAGQKHTRDLDSDVEVDEVPHVMVKKAKVGTHKWCKSQSLTYTMFIYVVSVLVQIKLHIPNVVNHNVTFSTFDGHVSQRMSFHISDIINCLIVNHQYYMNFQ